MTLLSQFTAQDVCDDPFPHVMVEGAAGPALCRRLIRDFPFTRFPSAEQCGANKKHFYPAAAALRDPMVSDAWKDLLNSHLMPTLWTDLVRVFQANLAAEYRHLEPDCGWNGMKVGVLGIDDFATCDVILDSKVLLHSPHDGDTPYERWPHIKRFSTLFLGYLYLRPDDDDSRGGDLAFYTLKHGAALELDARQTVDPGLLDVAKVVPYKQDQFVCFMNSPRSIQTNSPRSRSTRPLIGFHFDVYFPDALFTIPTKPGVAPIMLGRDLAHGKMIAARQRSI